LSTPSGSSLGLYDAESCKPAEADDRESLL
jgi:hypothetical protein